MSLGCVYLPERLCFLEQISWYFRTQRCLIILQTSMYYQNPCESLVIKIPVIYFFWLHFHFNSPISCLTLMFQRKGSIPQKRVIFHLWTVKLQRPWFGQPVGCKALECCFAVSKVIALSFPEFFMPGGCHMNKGSLVNKLQSLKNKIGFRYKSSFQLTKLCSPPHWRPSFTSKMVNTDLH